MSVLQGIGAGTGQGVVVGVALVVHGSQGTMARLLALPEDAAVVLVLEDLPAQRVDCGILRRAAGLVMAGSGVLCTALTVARELGLAVVAALGEAVKGIADGQWVRVDGMAGTVEVLAGGEGRRYRR